MQDFETSLLYRLITFDLEYRVTANDKSVQVYRKKGQEGISYSEVTSKPETLNGWLWDKIVFNMSGGRRCAITGIKKSQSESVKNKLLRLVGRFQAESIKLTFQKIGPSCETFKSLFSYRYTQHSIVENWRKENTELVRALDNDIAHEFLPENMSQNIKKSFN